MKKDKKIEMPKVPKQSKDLASRKKGATQKAIPRNI